MRLLDLDPEFLTVDIETKIMTIVDNIEKAQGVNFLCPKCFVDNEGEVGTHRVICWNSSVPQEVYPVPGRWEMEGSGFNDLTLKAGSSSVLLTGGCAAHFFITNGDIR